MTINGVATNYSMRLLGKCSLEVVERAVQQRVCYISGWKNIKRMKVGMELTYGFGPITNTRAWLTPGLGCDRNAKKGSTPL